MINNLFLNPFVVELCGVVLLAQCLCSSVEFPFSCLRGRLIVMTE